jgi:hypothetical protein
MALLKNLQKDNTGVFCEYWRLAQVNISYLRKDCHIDLVGYVNKAARDDGKEPIDSRSFDWAESEFPFNEDEPQNEREIAYEKIKAIKVKETVRNEDGTTSEIEKDGEFADAVDA